MSNRKAPDVIVIGAGVVGGSLAFHLVRMGASVTVFDKGGVCAGMSARSGALLRMHYTLAAEAELTWKSLEYFANWSDRVGHGSCHFVRTGFAVVVGAENTRKLRHNVAAMKALGIDTEVVGPEELKRIDPSVNIEDVALAAYEPQSGYADPVATTQGFADAAAHQGATFTLHTPIEAIITRGGRAAGVRGAGGHEFSAASICIVAGPWSDRLLKPLGVQIGIRSERAQIAFFRRESATWHLAYIDTIAGSYFRPHGDGLTLAGLGELSTGATPDPDRFRQENDPDFITEVGRRLGHRIIPMRGAAYAHGHAGIYDVSPDARAVMGAVPGVQGLYVAAGFSGTGFKTSPAVGAAMAELILTGRASTADLTPFSFERILSGKLIHSPTEYAMGAGFGHTL
ncbi:MAG: NAD(P)/FAD-dependent oxidoreductase [Candidatus Binataceae bacterium]